MEEEEGEFEVFGFAEADLESFEGLEVVIEDQRLEKKKKKIYLQMFVELEEGETVKTSFPHLFV